MIDSYQFGKIIIDGKTYTSDLIIYPDRIEAGWWRREGHALSIEDIAGIIASSPDTLIVGTGMSGLMRIPPETEKFIRSRKIKLIVQKTNEACRLFNDISKKERVAAAFHLTC
jgi:hypothetical protein